jgi:phosphonopyruvate decarboxylase
MIDPADFVAQLDRVGVSLYTGVPDSLLKELGKHVMDSLPRERHVIAANEGAAVGIGLGHTLRTGELAAVYLQNSGLGNTVNPLLSLCDPDVYGVPMLLVIGWRGQPGVKDEPQHVTQGRVMTAMLDAMEIPWSMLPTDPDELSEAVDRAAETARARCGPVAILVEKGTFSAPMTPRVVVDESESATRDRPTREGALAATIEAIPDGSLVIATTGMLSRELFELRQVAQTNGDRDFLTVGGMGHASSIALGVALRERDRGVWCLDGDGAALMHLGSMAVIGDHAPENFHHVLFNNGVHDSVGGQRTSVEVVDLVAVASAVGYRSASSTASVDEITERVRDLATTAGPNFLELRVAPGARSDLGRPTRTPSESRAAFMNAVGASSI